MAETCELDVADRMGLTLEEVAELLNLTRENSAIDSNADLQRSARIPRPPRWRTTSTTRDRGRPQRENPRESAYEQHGSGTMSAPTH